MERKEEMLNGDEWSGGGEVLPREGGEPEETGGRLSPSWRGLVISIVAAVILSVTATLLLGGMFRPNGAGAAGGCPGGTRCSLPAEGR